MKLRSSQDFAATYNGNKKGIGIGIENYVHVREEATAGTFLPPRVGTAGYSESDDTPSEDISAGPADTLGITVDGGSLLDVTLSLVGTNTGDLIAAEIVDKVNAALALAGSDSRIDADWDTTVAGHYYIASQKTGPNSSVVITAGVGGGGDVTPALKIGVANTGTEDVGTKGGDFLYMTKASLKVDQPFEPSEHRTGRQASSIIKKKIMSEGDLEMYFNLNTDTGDAIDPAVDLLLQSVFGNKEETASYIRYNSKQAQNKFMSFTQANNAFVRAMNGVYTKSLSISLVGDGEAKLTMPLKARDGLYASIAKLSAGATAEAELSLEAGEEWNFDIGAYVMVVDTDGRTVLAGADGTLRVLSRNTTTNTATLSSPVTASLGAFIVPYAPHVFDQAGIDNPITGLQGYVSFDNGATQVEEIRSCEITFDPVLEDQDNYYGADGNRGFVVGGRSDIKISLDVMLSVSQLSTVMKTRGDATFAMKIVLGDDTGRHFIFKAPKVKYAVPPIEMPDSGSIAIQLEGTCLQSETGALDAFEMEIVK